MPNFAKFSNFNLTRNQYLHIESIFSEFFKPKAVNRYFLSALTETPCLLSVVEQMKNITSQLIEFSVKQADIDQFRLMKNGYIQE